MFFCSSIDVDFFKKILVVSGIRFEIGVISSYFIIYLREKQNRVFKYYLMSIIALLEDSYDWGILSILPSKDILDCMKGRRSRRARRSFKYSAVSYDLTIIRVRSYLKLLPSASSQKWSIINTDRLLCSRQSFLPCCTPRDTTDDPTFSATRAPTILQDLFDKNPHDFW